MRVCVLAQASPCTWVAHYVAAFRRQHDTWVVGPAATDEDLRNWDREAARALIVPNDVHCSFKEDFDLAALFPDGWEPDLVVGIAGMGGDPLYAGVARLPYPTAFITVDTWQCLLDYREALKYDFVFAAQREYTTHLQETGSRHVFWLPLAFAPEAHHPVDAEKTHDVVFAGMTYVGAHQPRRGHLEGLAQRFSVLCEQGVFGEALCALYARGRMAYNRSAGQELNMRIFEAMGMGCALLTNRASEINGLLELFRDGKHLIAYDDEEDLVRKVAAYLAEPERLEAIARAGHEESLARHTYDHRVRQLTATVEDHMAHAAVPRPGTAYRGASLADYLPNVPGTVVDYGCGLGASRVALQCQGVTRLIGISTRAAIDARRGGSYDEILPLPATRIGEADTVVIKDLLALSIPAAEAVRRAHKLLRPGGIAVLRLTPEAVDHLGQPQDAGALETQLQALGFHLRLAGPLLEDGSLVIQARKRTRHLSEIVEEIYTRLRVPGIDVPDLVKRIPPGW